MHGGAHSHQIVAWLLEALAGDGGIAFEERLTLHNCLIYSECSANVLNKCSNVDRDGGRGRNLSANDGIDKLFFTTLGVALLQGNNLHSVFGISKRLMALLRQELDGFGLVGLDADISAAHLGCFHQQFQSHENLVGLLHHQTIVGGDIRLALHSIDNHTFGLGGWWWAQLDEGGEAGTAHTRDACLLDAIDNLVGREFWVKVELFQRGASVNALLPFVALDINDNGGLAIACGIDGGVNLGHGAADG